MSMQHRRHRPPHIFHFHLSYLLLSVAKNMCCWPLVVIFLASLANAAEEDFVTFETVVVSRTLPNLCIVQKRAEIFSEILETFFAYHLTLENVLLYLMCHQQDIPLYVKEERFY